MKKELKWTGPQLATLDVCIKSYELMVDGKLERRGYKCECCTKYNDGTELCRSCPIKLYTGKSCCDDTPFWAFDSIMFRSGNGGGFVETPEQKAAAQAEADFLKMVRAAGV